MGVLNYEMESASLFTMCASQGLRAGCVAGVLVNRTKQETPDEETAKRIESTSVASSSTPHGVSSPLRRDGRRSDGSATLNSADAARSLAAMNAR